jgi:hypothetical protein
MVQTIVGVSVIAVIFIVGCDKSSTTGSGAPPNPAPSEAPGTPAQPVAAAGPWTMDVGQLNPPSTPVAGKVAGQEFKPDKIELQGDDLVFRQGKEFFADKEIKLWLTGDRDSFEGLKIEVKPDAAIGPNTPGIYMKARTPASDLPAGCDLPDPPMLSKYAMKLEFGKIEGGKLPGKIHLCLPDKDKSYLAGSFTLDATALTAAKIVGKVALPAGTEKIKLEAAYLGHDAGGKPHSGFVGFTVNPKEEMYVSSMASRLESKGGEIRFRHGRVMPGTYLVVVAWDKRSLAWKWITVKDKDVAVDLAVEQGGTGEVEVTVPKDATERRVSLLPLDADGKLPAGAGDASLLAMQLSNQFTAVEVPAGQDKVTLNGLRPGTYRVFAGKATADVVIKPGAKAAAQLK